MNNLKRTSATNKKLSEDSGKNYSDDMWMIINNYILNLNI